MWKPTIDDHLCFWIINIILAIVYFCYVSITYEDWRIKKHNEKSKREAEERIREYKNEPRSFIISKYLIAKLNESDDVICAVCGEKCKLSDNFCFNCGANPKTGQVKGKDKCWECGRVIPDSYNDIFCVLCSDKSYGKRIK